MKIFRKRNLLIGITTFLVGIAASAAIWGVPKFMKRSTTTKGQVSAYLLDDKGGVDGLLLANGDQLRFSPETGFAIASRVKVGDEVTATGHAGSASSYGREIRVDQISSNGNTILEMPSGPGRPHGPRDHHGPKDRGDRETRPEPPSAAPVKTEAGPEPGKTEPDRARSNDANEKSTDSSDASPVAAPPEMFKASGTVRTHLVNGHGDIDGLILSNGEQVRFSPRVGKLVVTAEQGGSTTVSVEGTGVRNERGIVIHPTSITIGNQTITLGR